MADTMLGNMILEGDGQTFIAENSVRKEALITPMPLYLQDSEGTDVFDYGGVIKTINLSGIFVALNKTNAKAFIDEMEAFIQGSQDTKHGYPKEFVDDFRGTIKVKIMDCETTKSKGEPLIVRWTIKLVESSTNA